MALQKITEVAVDSAVTSADSPTLYVEKGGAFKRVSLDTAKELITDDLKSALGTNEISFTDNAYIKIVIVGDTITITPVASNISKYIITPCKAGDTFTVFATPLSGSGTIGAMRTAAFTDGEYKCLVRSAQTEALNGVDFKAPSDGYFIINALKSERGVVYKNGYDGFKQINDNTKSIADAYKTLATQGILAPTNTETGKVYNTTTPYGTTLSGFSTRQYSVSGGDYLLVTIDSLSSTESYKPAMFYDATGNFVGYANREGTSNTQNDVFVRVPDRATKMYISASDSSLVTVKKLAFEKEPKKTVKLENNVVTIVGTNYTITMSKHGNNNLFDIYSIADNQGNTLYTADTDWQGPYSMSVINNADGDAIESGAAYTGGNHAYAGTGGSGTPTARTSEIRVVADGVELSNGDIAEWNDFVDVKWINYVQAWNTKKADGTGREVLKEMPCWRFTADGTIKTSNNIKALEDIYINIYYGMQMAARWMDGGVYIPSATRIPTSMDVFTSDGLGTQFAGYETVGLDPNIIIKMGFDPLIDLGNGSMLISSAPIRDTRIHTSTGKLYIYMMYNCNLHANEHATYNAYYRFIKP